ncbi:MAG: 3-dehydroquinate synthase [Desulfobacterales bacterium]
MKVFNVQGTSGDSTILIGEKLRNLAKYISAEQTMLVTDANVRCHYQKDFPCREIIEVPTGERSKTLQTVETIYGKLIAFEAGRSSFIVGIGGGIVCDLTGFAASTYMRGVRFGFVASTLLAQVDAAIGGKNGVNFGGYKNMVGVFSQPEFVICDLDLLRTLPHKEIQCGLAEIVKHAVIGDTDLFQYLEDHYQKALKLDAAVMEKLVFDSIRIKSSIVNRDEKETGERKKLNFGHTFGHAIEKATGAPHGEAVGVGMMVACALSVKKGYLAIEDAERLEELLRNMRLSTTLRIDTDKVMDALGKDKKRKGEKVSFVLLGGIGKAIIEDISLRELAAAAKSMR